MAFVIIIIYLFSVMRIDRVENNVFVCGIYLVFLVLDHEIRKRVARKLNSYLNLFSFGYA